MTSSPVSGQSGSTCLNSPKDIDHHEDTEKEIEITKNSALWESRSRVLITEETFNQENTPKALPTQGICPIAARTRLQAKYISETAGGEGCFSQSSPRIHSQGESNPGQLRHYKY